MLIKVSNCEFLVRYLIFSSLVLLNSIFSEFSVIVTSSAAGYKDRNSLADWHFYMELNLRFFVDEIKRDGLFGDFWSLPLVLAVSILPFGGFLRSEKFCFVYLNWFIGFLPGGCVCRKTCCWSCTAMSN